MIAIAKKSKNNIKIQYLGANNQVTGSCTYVQIKTDKQLNFLVDFGGIQDNRLNVEDYYKANSNNLPIEFSKLDYVLITHAHSDHIFKVGMLKSLGFKGKILCTVPTVDLMQLNLTDSAYIMDKECQKFNTKNQTKGKKIYPLYTQNCVEWAIDNTLGYDYNALIDLDEYTTLEFLPAGHITGASMVSIVHKYDGQEKSMLFTGDTSGSREKVFTKSVDLKGRSYDYCQIESTYGNRLHPTKSPLEQLEQDIYNVVFERGKTLLIPVFAIARSTEVLHLLKQVYEKCPHFEDIPIYLASPMSCKAQRIVSKDNMFQHYDDKWSSEKDLFRWKQVTYIESFEDVKTQLMNSKPKIVLAASGMCENGYSKFLISSFAPQRGSKILFSGYQGDGTLGRLMLDKTQKSTTIDGKVIKFKADIDLLQGMSSHADMNDLINLVKQIKGIKHIAVVHGDEEASNNLKDKLSKIIKCDVEVPKYESIYKF